MCKWKCLKTLSQEKGKQLQQSSQLSEENQDEERYEANRRENESVRKIIEAYNNPFLLKYITMYWEDYDSVESNVRMDQHFQQLTERELNQLSYAVCNKHNKSINLVLSFLAELVISSLIHQTLQFIRIRELKLTESSNTILPTS